MTVIYVFYRKTYIGDGDYEPTERLMTTTNLDKIFTKENYVLLYKYTEKYLDGDMTRDKFYYFIMKFDLDKFNKEGNDDGVIFWDPEKRLDKKKTVFKGSLKDVKTKIENRLKISDLFNFNIKKSECQSESETDE